MERVLIIVVVLATFTAGPCLGSTDCYEEPTTRVSNGRWTKVSDDRYRLTCDNGYTSSEEDTVYADCYDASWEISARNPKCVRAQSAACETLDDEVERGRWTRVSDSRYEVVCDRDYTPSDGVKVYATCIGGYWSLSDEHPKCVRAQSAPCEPLDDQVERGRWTRVSDSRYEVVCDRDYAPSDGVKVYATCIGGYWSLSNEHPTCVRSQSSPCEPLDDKVERGRWTRVSDSRYEVVCDRDYVPSDGVKVYATCIGGYWSLSNEHPACVASQSTPCPPLVDRVQRGQWSYITEGRYQLACDRGYATYDGVDVFADCISGSWDISSRNPTCKWVGESSYTVSSSSYVYVDPSLCFKCRNGKCINPRLLNDGYDDCGDRGDERGRDSESCTGEPSSLQNGRWDVRSGRTATLQCNKDYYVGTVSGNPMPMTSGGYETQVTASCNQGFWELLIESPNCYTRRLTKTCCSESGRNCCCEGMSAKRVNLPISYTSTECVNWAGCHFGWAC